MPTRADDPHTIGAFFFIIGVFFFSHFSALALESRAQKPCGRDVAGHTFEGPEGADRVLGSAARFTLMTYDVPSDAVGLDRNQ